MDRFSQIEIVGDVGGSGIVILVLFVGVSDIVEAY